MKGEVKALDDRNVWELVDCPKDRKTIRCRWVYFVKSDGRKRARLVAKGFSQVPGLDFADTFSPVARFETVRLFGYSCSRRLGYRGAGCKNCILYGALDEELYMEQPQGFMRKGQEARFIASRKRYTD